VEKLDILHDNKLRKIGLAAAAAAATDMNNGQARKMRFDNKIIAIDRSQRFRSKD
jgi:hypothetical protein